MLRDGTQCATCVYTTQNILFLTTGISPLSTTCVLLLPPIRSPKCVDILDVEVVGLTSGGSVTWLQVIFYGIP